MTGKQIRLPTGDWGLLLDRKQPVAFSFDGIQSQGFSGDVIASALMASGRYVLSRSFKYHRPRGVLTMAGHDSNSMVQIGPEPNVRGDRRRISAGLTVTSINHLGKLDTDWLALLGLFSHFLPVGFYYKTFFRPQGAWRFFEKPIRALAGLGSLDPAAHHGYFDKQYLFCDVLVVGGGPAGLSAGIAAAESGAETLLIDEWPVLGGSLLYGRIDGSRADAEIKRIGLLSRARKLPNLRILTDTTVNGLFADNWASALRNNRLYKIRAKQTVLATGGYDQPIVFARNDLPGIMFADAAQRLMRLYGVRPGRRAVVATANRFGYDVALDLLDAGVAVAAIVDLRDKAPAQDGKAAMSRGVRILPRSTLVEAKGRKHVSAVAVASIIDQDRRGSPAWIGCDLVLMSAGYAPAINLACHTGAKVTYDPCIAMHRATDPPQDVNLAGSIAGVWSDASVCEHATSVGQLAAKAALGQSIVPLAPIEDVIAREITHPWPITAATTSAVDQVYRLMSFWNQQWRLDVDIANVTAAYAGINIAGPRARAVIEQLESDIDFSAEAFPYLTIRTGHLDGIPVRVLRVGFVGELGYEIHCPSAFGRRLWDRLLETGRRFGIKPFGVEAQRVLRLEKGHIIIGQDTDGLTHPAEVGMTWALSKTKPTYLGKRSIDMQIAKGLQRVLAGFALTDLAAPLPKENHLVIENHQIAGRVTSVVRSPTLNKVIGLAYLPVSRSSADTSFQIRVDGSRMVEAQVVPTPFYDPDQKRQEI
jgi:glycine cleavage system aminomethyltransferase T/NADPH-dependent 2,4-dienoyl-CoA reductase/sulfur reductase-like enzyme